MMGRGYRGMPEGRKTLGAGSQSTMMHMTQKQMQQAEEREELGLYLFKGHARTKMLAFKRILSSEFPLRMLPLDMFELQQDEDGFDIIV